MRRVRTKKGEMCCVVPVGLFILMFSGLEKKTGNVETKAWILQVFETQLASPSLSLALVALLSKS